MSALLILTALAAFGLEIHPGGAVRRAASEAPVCGSAAGFRARCGECLAVGAVFLVLIAATLLLPAETLDGPGVRAGALLLSAVVLLVAGWHRIATSSRLDLRRERLGAGAGETSRRVGELEAALGELRRPAWHLFWWPAAAGPVLAASGIAPWTPALVWLVYAAVALGWCAFVGSRLARAREKVVGTAEFRSLHSLGGLALVAASGVLLVRSLAATPVPDLAIEHVLKPLLGAG